MTGDTDTLDARIAELRTQWLHATWAGHDEIAALCRRRIDRLLDTRLEHTRETP